jgi:hypothetical protein
MYRGRVGESSSYLVDSYNVFYKETEGVCDLFIVTIVSIYIVYILSIEINRYIVSSIGSALMSPRVIARCPTIGATQRGYNEAKTFMRRLA